MEEEVEKEKKPGARGRGNRKEKREEDVEREGIVEGESVIGIHVF